MRMFLRSVQLAIVLVLGGLFVGCANYGERMEFNKGEVYYTEGVSEAEVKKLGEYLVKDGYFDGAEKSVQLQKEGDTFIFRAVIQEEYLSDPSLLQVFEVVGAQISQNAFGGAPVDIELTDEYFETKKTVPFNPVAVMPDSPTTVPDTAVTSPPSSGADSL